MFFLACLAHRDPRWRASSFGCFGWLGLPLLAWNLGHSASSASSSSSERIDEEQLWQIGTTVQVGNGAL
eukprot:767779-Amphidinium_carterae.1